ncbi:MAG: hypothetical protein ACYC5K_08140 [Saccharofermentanales bacterium]
MKAIKVIAACIMILLLSVSCAATSSDSGSSDQTSASRVSDAGDYADLLARIEDLEIEITELKAESAKVRNQTFLIEVMEKHNEFLSHLGNTVTNGVLKKVDFKLPKKEYDHLKIVIIIGSEKDGLISLDQTVIPGYSSENEGDLYQKYGIDIAESQISTLIIPDVPFDDDSCMLMFITDDNGFEHVEYVHSVNFSKDV